MKRTDRAVSAWFTPRQIALMDAVAEAEGMDRSELIRRSVSAFIWGSLDLSDMPATQGPAVLRLHDFPKIAASLRAAEERDNERRGIGFDSECPDCGQIFSSDRGLMIHRGHIHKVPA